ncbi:PKD family protein [Chitinophaga dinghuensis]|uniref:PKD family protein n=1 Tax=Chitinophaga dinghuensis TaxID=1539050 RepID=A0A327VKR9_9BACT|nr:PKD-like family lipoprotein [Chitinophaga dinghuensis]RAJ75092.1 PKD family protein [Chitinophaga dinghuensis]
MNRFINIFAALLLLAGFLTSGCYKDLGNYSYSPVNELKIDTFPYGMTVYQYDTIRLTPRVISTIENIPTDDTARFGYRWVLGTPDSSAVSMEYQQLATTFKLNAKVVVGAGVYGLYFEIRDKKTKQVYMRHMNKVTVASSTYEGWLVLSDISGNARLDMINYINGTALFTSDILSGSPDLPKPLKGPRKICYYPTSNYNTIPSPAWVDAKGNQMAGAKDFIYLSTDKGSWKLRSDALITQRAWNTWYEFLLPPEDSATFAPAFVGAGEIPANTSYIHVYDGKGNFYQRGPLNYFINAKANHMSGGNDFRAAPFIGRAVNGVANDYAALYDMDLKRFVRLASSGVCVALTNPTTPLFDFNNVGMDLVWMKTMGTLLNTFAVMKDPAGDMWLLVFDVRSAVSQTAKMKLDFPDIKNAKYFALDKNYGTLYYATDSKVYAVHKDFAGCYLLLDVGSRKISWMDQHTFTTYAKRYNGDPTSGTNTTNLEPYMANWLGVATYDPADPDHTGKLNFYYSKSFQTDQAVLVRKDEYSGFGKIVSVTYRERAQ